MKTILLVTILLFPGFFVFSQDIIYLKKGTEIKAKIIEIGTQKVKYKKYDFLEGPDYVIFKKEIEYILFENGKKELFYGKLTEEEYRKLCERKVVKFTREKKIGGTLAGAGVASFVYLLIDEYNYNTKYPNNNNYFRQFAYDVGYTFSAGAIAGGAVMYFIGKRKASEYSQKLNKISFGFNPVGKYNTFYLSYRF